MRTLIYCLAISVVINKASLFIQNLEAAWYYNECALHATIAIWIWYAMSVVDRSRIAERSVLAMAIIWQSVDSVFSIVDWMYPNVAPHFLFPTLILFVAWLLHTACRKYEYKSDKINMGNVHFCLWSPKNTKSAMLSTVGKPFGSVAIYAYNKLWTYRWNSNSFDCYDIENPLSLLKNYTIIDSGVMESDEIYDALLSAMGTKAKRWQTLWTRSGCICTILPALKAMGKEFVPRWIEYVPSFYAQKLIRMKEK